MSARDAAKRSQHSQPCEGHAFVRASKSAHSHAQGQTKGRREGCSPRARARPGTLSLRNTKRTGRRTNNVILFFFDFSTVF